MERDPAVDEGLPVPLGGVNMDEPGFRNAPSLMYAACWVGVVFANGLGGLLL